jgi:hypothetical protein
MYKESWVIVFKNRSGQECGDLRIITLLRNRPVVEVEQKGAVSWIFFRKQRMLEVEMHGKFKFNPF